MSVDPALILGVLVGIFNAALYVLIRGTAGGRLPLIVGAAVLGAWAGDTLGDRLGVTIALDRRLPPRGRVGRGVARDRDRHRPGRPRPDERQA